MSELVIEELGGRGRRITLAGRAVPYQGQEWAVEQRNETTWYPGVTRATQQVLGPIEEPTELNGMWKDAFIPNSVRVQSSGSLEFPQFAREVKQLFDDICRSGTELRVQWEDEVRTGLLGRFAGSYDRIQDLRWTMRFDWNGRDGETRAVAAVEAETSPQVRAASNDLDDIASLEPRTTLQQYALQANAFIRDTRGQVGTVLDGLREGAELASLPAALVGNVATAVESLRFQAQETISTFGEVPVNNAIAVSLVADILSVESWRREVSFSIGDLRASAQLAGRALEKRREPDATRVVTVPEGATLYDISNRYYLTPDFATFLAQFNGLPGALVPAGIEIVVPPKPRVQP